jgi:hypothetical protein
VATELLASNNTLPHEVLLARLTKRLCDRLALSQEAARWAVESWALAQGVICTKELQKPSPHPPTPADERPRSEGQRLAPGAVSTEELQPPGTAKRSVSSSWGHAAQSGSPIPSAPESRPRGKSASLPQPMSASQRWPRGSRRRAVPALLSPHPASERPPHAFFRRVSGSLREPERDFPVRYREPESGS